MLPATKCLLMPQAGGRALSWGEGGDTWMKSISWLRYVFCHSSLMVLFMSVILVVWKASSAFSSACVNHEVSKSR